MYRLYRTKVRINASSQSAAGLASATSFSCWPRTRCRRWSWKLSPWWKKVGTQLDSTKKSWAVKKCPPKEWLVWFNDLVWRENQCPNFVIVSCRFSEPFGMCIAWGKNRQPAVVAIADEVRKNMIWTLWIHGCDLVDFFWRRCIQTVEQCWTLV